MTETAISASRLSYLAGARRILDGIELSIPRGSFTVVVGENGAGKTTLLKLLMGFAKPSEGQVLMNGREPQLDPYADRQSVAYINEKMTPPNDWTIAEFLSFNRWFYRDYSSELEERLLATFKLKREDRVGTLSAGEVRRVQVVAALAISPRILLIDEITAVLDIVGRSKFMQALRELQDRAGTTIVMATNIIDDVDSYATHVVLLHAGRLALQAEKAELLRKAPAGQTLTDTLARLIEEAERQ